MEQKSSVVLKRQEITAGLRVLLDARKLWDGGIGRYTQNLINGLSVRPEVELTVILTSQVLKSKSVERSPWFPHVNVIEDNAKPYSYDEMFRMAKRISTANYDLYHVPHFTLPFGIEIPRVITVHDLIHLHYPEKPYYPLIARRWIKSGINRASRVLTVSQAALNDLKQFNRHKPALDQKLRLVPNALDPCFLRNCQPNDYLSNRFRLQGNYLLAVISMLKPHKGLKDLLRAFRNIKKEAASGALRGETGKIAADLKLVLVGKATEDLVKIDKLLERAGSIKDLYLYGMVSKEDLLNLYAGASALVVPSLAEGFGLMVIEAHAQGTPVIVRPVPALKEVILEDDVVCGDFSLSALQAGITEFLEKFSERDKTRSDFDLAGYLERFDRDQIARTVLQVYKEAVDDWQRKS